jgi:hypothetical protein|tara:strand:+ start:408 stop:590 length:183 start_codon:yes stop_codon:yes gene_type:complete
MGRYELRTISPNYGQTIVAIYNTIEEAMEGRDLKVRSQDLPVIIYDADEEQPVYPTPRGL